MMPDSDRDSARVQELQHRTQGLSNTSSNNIAYCLSRLAMYLRLAG